MKLDTMPRRTKKKKNNNNNNNRLTLAQIENRNGTVINIRERKDE